MRAAGSRSRAPAQAIRCRVGCQVYPSPKLLEHCCSCDWVRHLRFRTSDPRRWACEFVPNPELGRAEAKRAALRIDRRDPAFVCAGMQGTRGELDAEYGCISSHRAGRWFGVENSMI